MLVLLEIIERLKRANGTSSGMGVVSWAKGKFECP
jgi:hypothetical protein